MSLCAHYALIFEENKDGISFESDRYNLSLNIGERIYVESLVKMGI